MFYHDDALQASVFEARLVKPGGLAEILYESKEQNVPFQDGLDLLGVFPTQCEIEAAAVHPQEHVLEDDTMALFEGSALLAIMRGSGRVWQTPKHRRLNHFSHAFQDDLLHAAFTFKYYQATSVQRQIKTHFILKLNLCLFVTFYLKVNRKKFSR